MMLTIFSPPKPFTGHIDVIQRNAIKSWLELDKDIEVLLIGDEEGMRDVAAEYGVRQIPEVERNELGTPLVSSIFQLAGEHAHNSILCYLNADIILLDDFMDVVREVDSNFSKFLMIGQRWDLAIPEQMSFRKGWQQQLRGDLETKGCLHPPAGSDFFVYRRGTFENMPPFALGRAGWDNWMIFVGRARKIPVVDVTQRVTIIHQDHDYAHLPDGQPHYRLPESDENVRLSGGQETIFTLSDADWVFFNDAFRRKPWSERWSRRGVEASVISSFGPGRAARFFRMLFHPLETYRYYLHALGRRMKSIIGERKRIEGGRE
jgi:hypothetical protein